MKVSWITAVLMEKVKRGQPPGAKGSQRIELPVL